MPAEPLATMHTAVNSDNLTLPNGALWGPGASVSPEEALRAHTVGGAVACNLESEVGVLRCAQLLVVFFNGTYVWLSCFIELQLFFFPVLLILQQHSPTAVVPT